MPTIQSSSPIAHRVDQHSIRARVPYLIYNTKWFAPLVYVILFGLFGAVGAIWGSWVNSPHPPLGDLPLYPGAQTVVDQKGSSVTILSTDMVSRNVPEITYRFETKDAPEAVEAFYKSAMERTYGFVGTTIEQSDSTTKIMHFARAALRDAWVVELITVTIKSDRPDLTSVILSVQVNW